MTRLVVTTFGFVLTLVVATPARADLLGSKGDAIFGAERLFGVRGEHSRVDLPGPQTHEETNDTVISLAFTRDDVPYNVPRLAFDYMVVNQLSLGGSAGFSSARASTDFIVAPRIGFLHMFGRVAGIWPRGGFFYESTTVDNAYKESNLGLNLECMFPIVAAPHFGFELGFTFDQSLAGKQEPNVGASYDVSYRSIALQVGLFGWI